MEADEAGEEGDDLMTGEARATDDEVQGERLVLEDGEERSDSVGIGHHGALGVLRLAPDGEVHGRCHDVLVGNADIGPGGVVVMERTDGTAVGGRNGSHDDGAPIYVIGVELDAGLGTTVAVGRLVHHVDLLLGPYPRHVSVVAHADEQSSAIGIGKGRDRLGQFPCIGDSVLEVLLLVLALADEAEKIVFVVHSESKGTQKNEKTGKESKKFEKKVVPLHPKS